MTCFEFRSMSNHRLSFLQSPLEEPIKLLSRNTHSRVVILRNRNPGSIYKTVFLKICLLVIPSFLVQKFWEMIEKVVVHAARSDR